VLAIGGTFLWLAGCRFAGLQPEPPKHPAVASLPTEALRERAERIFAHAVFYKPSEESLSGPGGGMAPLIVQAAEGDASLGFGAVAGEFGHERIDLQRPTVYFDDAPVQLGGQQLDLQTFVWRYPSHCGSRRCASCCGRGFRVLLGSDGLPILWEALSTDDDRRRLFVSRTLEESARREFGDPLPGRAFSVEADPKDARDVVVVRLLDDADVAMGPYVYLDPSPDGDVTTILCRCMPSQVDAFLETRYYRLAPLESLGPSLPHPTCGLAYDFAHWPRLRWSGSMSCGEMRYYESEYSRLATMLRWPRVYR
jgi:hypothetical protein